MLRPGIRRASDLKLSITGARKSGTPGSRFGSGPSPWWRFCSGAFRWRWTWLEAAAYSEMAENITSEADFRLPKVNWELTGRDVLVTEWVEGTRLRDREALVAHGHDPRAIATAVVQSFLRHALRDGFFHADMHEGNLFVDKEGRLTAVDLGIMGRIGLKEQRFLAEILYGFIRRDYQRIAEVHIEAGYVPRIHSAEDFAQALRAIGEPIHGSPRERDLHGETSRSALQVTEIFDMQTPPSWCFCRRPWWSWKAWRGGSTQFDMDHGRAGGTRVD